MATKRFQYTTRGAVDCRSCGDVIHGDTIELRELDEAGNAAGSTYYHPDCAPCCSFHAAGGARSLSCGGDEPQASACNGVRCMACLDVGCPMERVRPRGCTYCGYSWHTDAIGVAEPCPKCNERTCTLSAPCMALGCWTCDPARFPGISDADGCGACGRLGCPNCDSEPDPVAHDGGAELRALGGAAVSAPTLAAIRAIEPEAHVTYHHPHGPSAGGYVVHVWGRELSSYCPTEAQALGCAWERLTRGQP